MGKLTKTNVSNELNLKLDLLETTKNFYVDGVNGSDSNDGLSETTPFKTIKHLSKYLFGKIIPGKVNILIKPGNYSDSLVICLPVSNVIIDTYGGTGKATFTAVNTKYIQESILGTNINFSILIEGTKYCVIQKNIEVVPNIIPVENTTILVLSEFSFTDLNCDINLLNSDIKPTEVRLINAAGSSTGVRVSNNVISVNNYNFTKKYSIHSMSGASLTMVNTDTVGLILRSTDSNGSIYDLRNKLMRITENTTYDSGFDVNKIVNGIVFETNQNSNGVYIKYSCGIADISCTKKVIDVEPNSITNVEFIHPLVPLQGFSVTHGAYTGVEGINIVGAAGDERHTVIRVENRTGFKATVFIHVRILGQIAK